MIKVEKGVGNNENSVTRHDQFKVPINLINFYGQQECRHPKDYIEGHWNEILAVISKFEARNEMVVLAGDAN